MPEARLGELADRMAQAYAGNDIDGLRELFHPTAVVWHNVDRTEMTVDEVLARSAARPMGSVTFVNVRRRFFDGGWVQQYEMHVQPMTGGQRVVDACAVIHVSDGHIVRVDEYMDSAQLSPA